MLGSSLDWLKLRVFVGVFCATSSPDVAVCLEQIVTSCLVSWKCLLSIFLLIIV